MVAPKETTRWGRTHKKPKDLSVCESEDRGCGVGIYTFNILWYFTCFTSSDDVMNMYYDVRSGCDFGVTHDSWLSPNGAGSTVHHSFVGSWPKVRCKGKTYMWVSVDLQQFFFLSILFFSLFLFVFFLFILSFLRKKKTSLGGSTCRYTTSSTHHNSATSANPHHKSVVLPFLEEKIYDSPTSFSYKVPYKNISTNSHTDTNETFRVERLWSEGDWQRHHRR